MNILQQCSIISFLLQVSYSYGSYQKEQIIPYYRRNIIPFNSCGSRWLYTSSNNYPNVPNLYNYDKNNYYPYSSYKYSYVKYPQNKYKSGLSSPKDRYCYINPTIHGEKTRNMRFIGYMPESRGYNRNYYSNYFSTFGKPNSEYTNSLLFNNRNNNLNTYKTLKIFPNIYSHLLPLMSQQNSFTTTKSPLILSTEIDTIGIKYENQVNRLDEKIQYMFPSEIVIRSLGPWAQVGDKSEYRSNGTFSIKYEKPGMMALFDNKKDTFNTYYFSSTDLIPKEMYIWNDSNFLTKTKLFSKKFEQNNDQRKAEFNIKKYFKNNFLKRPVHLYPKTKNKKSRKSVSENLRRKKNLKGKCMDDILKSNKKTIIPINKNQSQDELEVEDLVKNYPKIPRRQVNKRTYISADYNPSSSTTLNPVTGSTETSVTTNITTTKRITTTTTTTTTTSTETQVTKATKKHGTLMEPTKASPQEMSGITFQYKRPESSPENEAKIECEQINNIKCVCSIRKSLTDLDEIIASHNDSKQLLSSLALYSCSAYTPLQNVYNISADMKPRLISNKPKELLVDAESGPKEIKTSTMEELMSRGVPNEGIDFYVFSSTNIEIPCTTSNDIKLSPNTADSTTYTWTHGNQKLITEGRITEDLQHKGSLQIKGATLEDSDNYTCTVNYTDPDTETTTTESFLHTVLVVAEPTVALHILMHYHSKSKCDQETLEMFELYIPQQLEKLICQNDESLKICNIEIYNPMCQTKRSQKHSRHAVKKDVYEIPLSKAKEKTDKKDSMEVSLNYEVETGNIWDLMPSTVNKTHCTPFCQQKVLLKITEILKESITEALNYPVESSLGIKFEPDESIMNLKMVIACSGGLRLLQGFCVPCPRGYYSKEGSTQCTKCPPGTYQDNKGGKSCEECPHPFRNGCFEMWYTPVMSIIFGANIIILILSCCLLMYCCQARSGSSKKSTSLKSSKERKSPKKENTTNSKKKKSKKEDKKIKATNLSDEAPSLPPEDFSAED